MLQLPRVVPEAAAPGNPQPLRDGEQHTRHHNNCHSHHQQQQRRSMPRRPQGVDVPHVLLSMLFRTLENRFPTSKYSVSRLQDFQNYDRVTTVSRIVFMMLLCPLPSIAVTTMFNFWPHVPPSHGVAANYSVFIHAYVGSLSCMIVLKLQRPFYLKVKTSMKTNAILANVLAGLYTTSLVALPFVFGKYPVPFSPLLGMAMACPVALMLLAVQLRKHQALQSSNQHHSNATGPARTTSTRTRTSSTSSTSSTSTSDHSNEHIVMNKYKKLIAFEISLFFVYSFFSMGFQRLNTSYQTIYVCLLPIIKFGLVQIARKLVSMSEDVAAETVVFSVEFFNAMYTSISMGRARSNWTSVILVSVDFVQLVFHLTRLSFKTKLLVRVHRQTNSTRSLRSLGDDVITASLQFASVYKQQILQPSASSLSYSPGHGNNGIRFESSNNLKFTPALSWFGLGLKQHSVSPEAICVGTRWGNRAVLTKKQKAIKLQLLREVLAMMYMIERMVLAEFVEAFVPFFYALYVITSFFSPNRQYFYGILDMSHQSMRRNVVNMVLYGGFEWVSLLVLYQVVKKRFGMNVFKVLSFVLDVQFANIQSKMVFFMILILNITLIHYGMDFEFRFQGQIDLDDHQVNAINGSTSSAPTRT